MLVTNGPAWLEQPARITDDRKTNERITFFIKAPENREVGIILSFNLLININDIYHNIPCVHRRRGPQRVSAACGPFPAPFPVHIVKKRA